MKALVVYESMWGNTEQVAEAIAAGLKQAMDVEVTEVQHAPAAPGPEFALIVAGGPTHAFSLSRETTRSDAINQGADHGSAQRGLREWLEALPTGPHPQQIATFDTRASVVRHLPGSAAKGAAKMAHRHGFQRAAYIESFYVKDTEGPLLDGELDRARTWGRQIGADIGSHAH